MGNKGIGPPFLTSALDGGELSASRPAHFTHRYSLGRRLGGPQFWSGNCGEGESVDPVRNETPAIQPIAHHYPDSHLSQ
jgi:hypothetical protein